MLNSSQLGGKFRHIIQLWSINCQIPLLELHSKWMFVCGMEEKTFKSAGMFLNMALLLKMDIWHECKSNIQPASKDHFKQNPTCVLTAEVTLDPLVALWKTKMPTRRISHSFAGCQQHPLIYKHEEFWQLFSLIKNKLSSRMQAN